ncbi:ExeA family protein [Sphingopyxis yananensis]|uniref:ExeA family protein n=1 Tax=Sphingopyxis yananensis TaxID=2886687 RepID=UPI001D106D6C|nr:AAA family ATPase [Sphingopyxis yananensis]
MAQHRHGHVAMYDQFYGFTGRPFQLTADPHYYFESATHRKAMSYLEYGLAQGEGIILITGDAGMGKTALAGHLMESLEQLLAEQNHCHGVQLTIPDQGADDFLMVAAEEFGLAYQAEEQEILLRGIEIYLRGELRAGRRTVLIIDDAQNLSIAALEQLLLLAALQQDGQQLMQIFLIGQPEFRQILFHSPSLDALRQRVIATHHLEPMEADELEPYIFHRLAKVGWNGNPIIAADAFAEIFTHSKGIPRLVNRLFSRILLHGALEEVTRISAQTVRDVVSELSGDRDEAGTASPAQAGDASLATVATKLAAKVAAQPSGAKPVDPSVPKKDAGQPSASTVKDSPAMIATAEYVMLQHRVAKLEARLSEQDMAMRQMIELLIQWVDQQDQDAEILFPDQMAPRAAAE